MKDSSILLDTLLQDTGTTVDCLDCPYLEREQQPRDNIGGVITLFSCGAEKDSQCQRV